MENTYILDFEKDYEKYKKDDVSIVREFAAESNNIKIVFDRLSDDNIFIKKVESLDKSNIKLLLFFYIISKLRQRTKDEGNEINHILNENDISNTILSFQ
jgi:hypothetical protein